MHDLRTIFRNSLLFCAIVANLCFISLIFALDITYEVGGVTRTGEFIPNQAAANGSKAVYAPNSAAKMPNGTRIPYGLRGTLRTGSKLFKQLLLLDAGIEVVDWIKSQYSLQSNEDIAYTQGELQKITNIETYNYFCTNECYWRVTAGNLQKFDTLFAAAAAAQGYGTQQNRDICNRTGWSCTYQSQFMNNGIDYQFIVNKYQNGTYMGGNGYAALFKGATAGRTSLGLQTYQKRVPLGEPTIAPNPWRTGEIIEAYAGKVGGWGDFVSPNVQILDQPIRWTELPAPAGMPIVDTVTDLIRVPGYEPKPPALIPDPEPLRPDPDGLKKIPNPLLQGLPDPTTPHPPPAVRTNDLIGGGMTVTNTYNLTNNNTSTRVELNLENKEITYTPDDSEIEVPADLTVEEIDSNMPRLKIPVLEPERLVDAAFNAAGGFVVPDLLDDKSDSCPPPRTLAIIGGATVQMPFDPLCDFLAMIKKVFVPVVGWIIFLMWIRRIGSS